MLRLSLFVFLAVTAIGGYLLYDSVRVESSDWDVAEEVTELPEDRSSELARARQSCKREDLLAFLAEQEALVEAAPEDVEALRVLAETHLELGQLSDLKTGLVIGAPIREEISDQLRVHIDAGTAALERGRELGDQHVDSFRIEASLYALEIHSLASALRVNLAATAALDTAKELDQAHPRVEVALGARLLFAPSILGGDPARGREHLMAGAAGLPYDERPLLFAAMASWETEDYEESRRVLELAYERTPANPFVAEVRRRIDAGEDDPFIRSLE